MRKERGFIQNLKMLADRDNYAQAMGGLPQNHAEVFRKRGWLLPYLFAYDNMLWGRWNYWFEIIEKKAIKGSGPIPQIEFSTINDNGVQDTLNMLRKCLSHQEANINNFSDWILWGFGRTGGLTISKPLNKHYYSNFDILLLQDNPYDYFSIVLEEQSSKDYKKKNNFFSTPFEVTVLNYKLINKSEQKSEIVYDPCVGCGALVLPASNYCLKAYGQDINQTALNLCLIQFIIYAPWFAHHPDYIDLTE